MSQRIKLENPVCIMQIHTAKRGRLSDAGSFEREWLDFTKARRNLTRREELTRRVRILLWNLEIKAKAIWHRMALFLK